MFDGVVHRLQPSVKYERLKLGMFERKRTRVVFLMPLKLLIFGPEGTETSLKVRRKVETEGDAHPGSCRL